MQRCLDYWKSENTGARLGKKAVEEVTEAIQEGTPLFGDRDELNDASSYHGLDHVEL